MPIRRYYLVFRLTMRGIASAAQAQIAIVLESPRFSNTGDHLRVSRSIFLCPITNVMSCRCATEVVLRYLVLPVP